MDVIHFKTQEERLAYLKGGFEEIKPEKAEKTAKNAKNDDLEPKYAKKPQKTASKSKKSASKAKKGAKQDEVQAE